MLVGVIVIFRYVPFKPSLTIERNISLLFLSTLPSFNGLSYSIGGYFRSLFVISPVVSYTKLLLF